MFFDFAVREYTSGRVVIYQYQRGLLYQRGHFVRELGAGSYRIAFWRRDTKIVVCSQREISIPVGGQKLLLSDGVTITLNFSLAASVVDARALFESLEQPRTRFYEDAQASAREVLTPLTIDELLARRAELSAPLTQTLAARAELYGVAVREMAIKDTIFAARVRDLLMREFEIKRAAVASLAGAREEVAALRALGNAARLTRDNPDLLRLRELQLAAQFAARGGNSLVLGLQNPTALAPQISERNSRSSAPEADQKTEAGDEPLDLA